jgi:hypothetical protein
MYVKYKWTAPMPSTDQLLDATFAALADPTRRAIVVRLAGGDATVLELAAPFDISLPAGRDAQRRPCTLRPDALASVSAWAEHTRRAWEERFDRLDEYLEDLQKPTDKQEKQHVSRKRR